MLFCAGLRVHMLLPRPVGRGHPRGMQRRDLKRKCALIRTIAQAGKQPATRHSKWLASLATAVLAPTQVGMLLALQAFTCRNLQDLRWNTATHRFTRRREPVVRLGARSCKDVLCRNQGVSHIDMSLLPRRSSCKKM